jgi:putative ubiquitin-RnfH superfamily antitoxin RatB of RatAB toxin-antitoxin module
MQVEVVYLGAAGVFRRTVELPAQATLGAALAASEVLVRQPEIDWRAGYGVGIFGRPAALDRPLRPGDRVEIYPPLREDPRERRRRQAAAARTVADRPGRD